METVLDIVQKRAPASDTRANVPKSFHAVLDRVSASANPAKAPAGMLCRSGGR